MLQHRSAREQIKISLIADGTPGIFFIFLFKGVELEVWMRAEPIVVRSVSFIWHRGEIYTVQS